MRKVAGRFLTLLDLPSAPAHRQHLPHGHPLPANSSQNQLQWLWLLDLNTSDIYHWLLLPNATLLPAKLGTCIQHNTVTICSKDYSGFYSDRLAPCMNSRDERLFLRETVLRPWKTAFPGNSTWVALEAWFLLSKYSEASTIFQSDMLLNYQEK